MKEEIKKISCIECNEKLKVLYEGLQKLCFCPLCGEELESIIDDICEVDEELETW